MNKYNVYVDITMSYVISVEAESEETASAIALKTINEEPYYFAAKGTWVDTGVVDIEREEVENDD